MWNLVQTRLIGLIAVLAMCGVVFVGCDHGPAGAVLTYEIDQTTSGQLPTTEMGSLITQMNHRLRSLGEARAKNDKQLTVDVYGTPSAADLERIKRLVGNMGYLEFRILADPAHPKDRAIVEVAIAAPATEKEILLDGNKVAEWVRYAASEFGPVDKQVNGMVKRRAGEVPEMLILMDSMNVTGKHIATSVKSLDEQGNPQIDIALTKEGATRFSKLTGQNVPDPATGSLRHLGIILDKQLLSAPAVRSTISNRASISGGSMTDRDVDLTVDILIGGALPCPVRLVDEKVIAREK